MHGAEEAAYERLVKLVKAHIEEKRLKKNRDIKLGALDGQQANSAKGKGKKQKGVCWQYQKKGVCNRGDDCSLIHDTENAEERRGRSKGKGKGKGKNRSKSDQAETSEKEKSSRS